MQGGTCAAGTPTLILGDDTNAYSFFDHYFAMSFRNFLVIIFIFVCSNKIGN